MISEYRNGDKHAWVTKNLTKQCYMIRTNTGEVFKAPTLDRAEAVAEDWVLENWVDSGEIQAQQPGAGDESGN